MNVVQHGDLQTSRRGLTLDVVSLIRRLFPIGVAVILSCPSASAQDVDVKFTRAVASYVALHRASTAELASFPDDPTARQNTAAALAQRIQAARRNARAGDILGPSAGRIRSVVATEIAGPRGRATLLAIEQSNVRGARVRVNHRYPPGLPRVTMPGTILARLPMVPEELEYRFLGRSLMLVDTRADLIVDILPDVLPTAQH
jgi:hypothetical protein